MFVPLCSKESCCCGFYGNFGFAMPRTIFSVRIRKCTGLWFDRFVGWLGRVPGCGSFVLLFCPSTYNSRLPILYAFISACLATGTLCSHKLDPHPKTLLRQENFRTQNIKLFFLKILGFQIRLWNEPLPYEPLTRFAQKS